MMEPNDRHEMGAATNLAARTAIAAMALLLALPAVWPVAGCGGSGSPALPDALVRDAPGDGPVADAPGPDGPIPDAGMPPDGAPADCDALPPLPVTATFLPQFPASEDFTFDRDGFLIGVEMATSALKKTNRQGQSQLIRPAVSSFARGTRILPGGDILVADPNTNTLRRIGPQGGSTTILSGLPDPNGLAIGFDGFAYLTHGSGEIRRINPTTGAFTIIHTANDSFDGITFSPDYRTLYFNQEFGEIFAMPIAQDGTPGTPAQLALIPPRFLLDGMTADACGNLYVVEMEGIIWRVTPQGVVEMATDLRPVAPEVFTFIPAVNFGSGVGGWRRDALYVINFEGGIYEAIIGVPGKAEPHLPPPPPGM